MAPRKLRLDPHLPWEGGSPYEVLARFGVTPESTARQVLDASFDMTDQDLANPRVNVAWESLRVSRDRLLVDFFCAELPDEPAPAPAAAGPLPQLPWGYLHQLAAAWPGLPAAGEEAMPPPQLPPALAGNLPLWEAGVAEPAEGGQP